VEEKKPILVSQYKKKKVVPFLTLVPSPVVSTDEFQQARSAPGMDLVRNAKVVRLRSHHEKYLVAEEDKESVFQGRNGSSRNALWTVELVLLCERSRISHTNKKQAEQM
jgi:hypothetical protein